MIVITFVFPIAVVTMVIIFARATRRKIAGRDHRIHEQDLLIDILEKLVATKDKIIEKLKF